ncbi:MAG: phosphohydrolase [Synergistaceae bacterium]|nr:phosphohydrolase [Synergistaceae bacterium]
MGESTLNERRLLNIISHTDLDGVAAAVVAWYAHSLSGVPIKVSLTGYGEVDNLIIEAWRKSERIVTLDLSPQFQNTVDEIDRTFDGDEPFLFDHHQSTHEKFANRPWIVVDMNYCAASVYWNWLMERADSETRRRVEVLRDIVGIANDRDLWINENPDGRLWQAMVTLCGEWGAFARLITNPSAVFTEPERELVNNFVASQELRFSRAMEHIVKNRIPGNDAHGGMAFLGDGYLEFGDTSDFCGAILDRPKPGDDVPAVVALAYRKPSGGWAVSIRSRSGLAGRIVALLKDGRKIRGGGHLDAAALYFPPNYSEDSIRESMLAVLAAEHESASGMGVTLGDLLKGAV